MPRWLQLSLDVSWAEAPRCPVVAVCESFEGGSELRRVEDLEVDVEQPEVERQLVWCVRSDLDDATVFADHIWRDWDR